jgi:PAS domain S-box-containing protein
MTTLPRSVKLLIAGATLLGLGCVAIRVPEIARWGVGDVLAMLLIASLTIVTERNSIPLRHGSETVNFALTDGVWAGALLLVSPSVLTVSVLLGVGVGQALNRWKPYKIAYNVSQFLIGITLAEATFAILGVLGDGPTDPVLWLAVFGAMYVSFAVNATAIVLVVSMVEGERFLDVFRLPLSLNVVHWLGNTALGILAAVLWTLEPIALVLMVAPVALTFTTYRRWVESIRERDQMRDLYEAGRALSAPLASDDDFGGFLSLLEKLLPADRVELVVVEGNRVAVHASAGVRHLMVEDADTAPLEAFVAVRSGVSPQIAMVGDGQGVRGVLAVYRAQVLTATERLLLDGLADQIAVRLQDHRLFGTALERARLSEIVSHTSDGVFVVDIRGRITTWNPAMETLSGYSERQALGRRCEDVLGLERDSFFFEDDAGDGEPWNTSVRTREGTKEVRLRTSVIRDEEGAPPARIVVVRDAGEEARAEQIKRDFVSMVSHELRTPLTPLKGFLLSLVEGTVEDSAEKRQEYYRIMLRQAQRLERTVNDMLDASQIEAGGLVVDLQPVPLDHVLTRLVREFREQHPERTVRLGEVGRSAVVLADPFRVEQVVLNLLSNADKYTPAGLPISVSAVPIGDQVTISVRDRGEGIAREHRERIFDRFFRVTDGDGPARQGSGLGLYIARTLVEAMSGRIWVYSDVGVGTTFSFSLPVVDLTIVGEAEPFELPPAEPVPPTALIRG